MKLGVVHFGWALAGTAQILQSLVDSVSGQEVVIYGIEYNKTSKGIELRDITKVNSPSKYGVNKYEVASFPVDEWNENSLQIANKLSDLDKVIVLGGGEVKTDYLNSKLLHVPVSIFNNVKNSQYTLGFDTALNSIVRNIESVRDTASSLCYGKVRVFNVQIPGDEPSDLLKHTGLAIEGLVVTKVDETEIEAIKQHIRNKELKQEGYTFLVMNDRVDPLGLGESFKEFDLDWKLVEIDESQCGGPFPTAKDRILANQLKVAILEWIHSDQPSGQLLIQNNQVLLSK